MTTTPVDQQLPSSLNEQFINYSLNSETQNMDKNETVNMDNNNQNTDLTSKVKDEEGNLVNFDASEEMKKSIEMVRPELTDSTSYTFLAKSVASINLADIENSVVHKPAFDSNNIGLLTSQQNSPFNPKNTCTNDNAENHSSTTLLTVDDVADLSKPPQHVVVQKTLENFSSTSHNFSPLFDPLSISNDPVDSKASSIIDKQLLSAAAEVNSSSVVKTETILAKSPELSGQISAISEVGYSEPSENVEIVENDIKPDSNVQPVASHTETHTELPPVDHHLVKHFQNVEAEEVDKILSKSDSAEIVFTPSTIITEPSKTTDNTTTEQQQPVEMKPTVATKKIPNDNSNNKKKEASALIKPRCESATATTSKISSNHQNLKQTSKTTTTGGKVASSSRPVNSKSSGRKTATSSPLVSSTGTTATRTAPRTTTAAATVSSRTAASKNLLKSTAPTSTTFKSSSIITAKCPTAKSPSTVHKTDSKYMTNGALKSNSLEKKPIAKNDSATAKKAAAPTTTTTTGAKQIESRKLEWNVKAKVGSLENAQHKPTTTGRVQIFNQKLNFKNAKSKIGSMDNIKHKPAGGNVKIFEQKVDFKSKASPKYDIGITKKKEITVVEAPADQAAAAAAAQQPMQQQN
ncbi:Microtubule-associated protein 4 [Trichinella spiralis]|uniref:Microtubule-associated protein n=1 Tax=Trichinella spiralis TaxID=6334 RepID=A0A0V1AZY2_TRISP|nr:Microtubule-associated protein 4 [Trichinella spiralis]